MNEPSPSAVRKYTLFDGWSCLAVSSMDFVIQLKQSNPMEKDLTNRQYMQNFCKRHLVTRGILTDELGTSVLSFESEEKFVDTLLKNDLLEIGFLN